MEKTVFFIITVCFFSRGLAQETRYRDFKIETNEITISAVDAVAVDDITKFKIKITNNTNDFLIYKISESRFVINGKEWNPNEKPLIIEPHESGSRVINLKGDKYYTAKHYSFLVNGLYRVSLTGKNFTAPDFKLPPSQNDFKAGNFNCSLLKSSKETDRAEVKFQCNYSGDKIGFVIPSKAAVKMPDGNEYANANAKAEPMMLMKGETEDFKLFWNRMSGGRTMDMQFAEMYITWRDVFVESAPVKYKPQSLEMHDIRDASYNPSTASNTLVLEQTKQEQPEKITPKEEEPQYRGSGDPLKGLNVSKAKTLEIGNYYALIIGINNSYITRP